MKYHVLAIMLAVPVVAAAQSHDEKALPPEVSETSFATPDGARTLQQSIVIAAPLPLLWRAFTEAEAFKRWNSPVAAIDMRVGGTLEASYDAKHALGDPDNIKHRVITFLPERLIVFQNIQAPANLPGAAAFQRTVTVVEYAALAPGRTRVQISSTGWGSDEASNRLYGFFRGGNASLLKKMKTVFEAPAAAK